MGCQGCRVFVAFLLKFLNFIQAFIGASMILYAIWMLNRWNSHVRPPPIAPAPNNVDGYNLPAELMSLHSSVGQQLEVPFSNPQTIARADRLQFRKLGQHSFDIVAGADLDVHSLPAPWFIYTCLGIGIIVCVITCIGHIAAEITNGFCLSCYSILIVLLILVEAALVGDIFLNHNWEKDIPNDPTGEFENTKEFIEHNIDICKWVALTVVIIQAFSLLLATILRAMVSTRRPDYDSDDGDYISSRSTSHQPLLSQGSETPSGPVTGKNRSKSRDAWSKRMREKYASNPNEFTFSSTEPNITDPNTESRCAIM